MRVFGEHLDQVNARACVDTDERTPDDLYPTPAYLQYMLFADLPVSDATSQPLGHVKTLPSSELQLNSGTTRNPAARGRRGAGQALTVQEQHWFYSQIEAADPQHRVVTADPHNGLLTYAETFRSNEPLVRSADDEELVRALTLCLLTNHNYGYDPTHFYIERYIQRPAADFRQGNGGKTTSKDPVCRAVK